MIGRLSYPNFCVTKGDPEKRISSRDVRFIEMKMGLVIHVLLIAHNKEIVILNEFMKNEQELNQSNSMKLCQIFKEKSDSKCVFPKLPCLMKI